MHLNTKLYTNKNEYICIKKLDNYVIENKEYFIFI